MVIQFFSVILWAEYYDLQGANIEYFLHSFTVRKNPCFFYLLVKKNKEKRKSKNGDSFLVRRGLVNPKNWYEKLKFMKKCEKT